jgi:hypothetical protein
VSNFTEIIFLNFSDINFGAFSLAENKSCLKIIFDHGNEFLRLNWSKKHFFYFRFSFKNDIFWSLKIIKIGIFSQNQILRRFSLTNSLIYQSHRSFWSFRDLQNPRFSGSPILIMPWHATADFHLTTRVI